MKPNETPEQKLERVRHELNVANTATALRRHVLAELAKQNGKSNGTITV